MTRVRRLKRLKRLGQPRWLRWPRRLLRGVAYLVVPGELALLVCLMAGLRPPAPLLAAAEGPSCSC
ncbi:hypothetical protein [Streptomyces sp. I6]|uniref:hypothetical protein n=1 Tax=Streptomyces sp. I6 TaxID=2483113 RepID=UPI000F449E74|nr:hypothetical protein [Streptomyces sp. I6]RNL70942.1 hypothetical protein EBF04_07430 [Streptomyces sp. I6]